MAIRTDGDGGHSFLRLRRRSQWKRGDRTGDRNNCAIANEFRDDAGIMSLQATDEGHMARRRTTGGYPGQLRKPPNKEPDAY